MSRIFLISLWASGVLCTAKDLTSALALMPMEHQLLSDFRLMQIRHASAAVLNLLDEEHI